MSDTLLRAIDRLLIPITILRGNFFYYLHFADEKTEVQCSGQNASQNISVLILETCECYLTQQKGIWKCNESRIFRWREYLVHPGGFDVITRVFITGKQWSQEAQSRRGYYGRRGWRNAEKGHDPGDLQKREEVRKETQFLSHSIFLLNALLLLVGTK